jgi:hypothetical protein
LIVGALSRAGASLAGNAVGAAGGVGVARLARPGSIDAAMARRSDTLVVGALRSTAAGRAGVSALTAGAIGIAGLTGSAAVHAARAPRVDALAVGALLAAAADLASGSVVPARHRRVGGRDARPVGGATAGEAGGAAAAAVTLARNRADAGLADFRGRAEDAGAAARATCRRGRPGLAEPVAATAAVAVGRIASAAGLATRGNKGGCYPYRKGQHEGSKRAHGRLS